MRHLRLHPFWRTRAVGSRFECTRCGDFFRLPMYVAEAGSYPLLCGACIMDDIAEATLRCPRPRVFGLPPDAYTITEGHDVGSSS